MDEPVTDLDRWLAVWEDLRDANQNPDDHSAINQLCLALDGLYRLLEPPSARVARQINADGEASSRT
jgi:hypothetical protein